MGRMNWEELLIPYENCIKELTVKFNCLAAEFNTKGQHSPIQSVESRVKKVSSILDKCRRKGCAPEAFEDVLEDVAGVRIICRFVEDIAEVVRLMKQRDGVDLTIARERDYVSRMKVSGYRSYHVIVEYPVFLSSGKRDVICEIQIRTMAMNFWAVTEHSLRYKYNKQIPPDIHKRLIESADAAFMMDRKMSEIRLDILAADNYNAGRERMVDEILDNIRALYTVAGADEVSEVERINRRFMDIMSSGDYRQLDDLHKRVGLMAEIYRSKMAPRTQAL